MTTILVLNGPNLNLLGSREPEVYGATTLPEIEDRVRTAAAERGIETVFFQSNGEGAIIDELHRRREEVDAVIINPAAYTHTSVALHDALKAVSLPTVEVHLSNPHAREEFRHRSFVSPVALAVIAGAGPLGYELAIQVLAEHLA